MSETSGQERTEAPTPKRLQKARDEGQIARSVELHTAALLLGTAFTIAQLLPAGGTRLYGLVGTSLHRLGEATDTASTLQLLQQAGWSTLIIVLLLCAVTAVLTLAVGFAQTRGALSSEALSLKWARINPLTNAKQLLGTRAPVELLKSLLKVVLFAAVSWAVLSRAWPDLIDLGSRGTLDVVASLRLHIGRLFLWAGGAYLVLAALDYGWQLWQHHKQLMMTKDEVRQEAKQSDGDPLLKSRIRALARARLRKQMLRDVPKADVVIVNPTHRAVALRYDPLAAPAPIVLALGERKVAERIKEIAKEHGVPMVENRPLAIALIASAKVGMVIPAELYVAVAEVLAFVFRQKALQGRQPSWAPAGGR